MKFYVFIILYSAIAGIFTAWVTDYDGFFKKQKLNKYLDDVIYYQAHKDEKQITISYKDKPFTIKADSLKHNSYYEAIALYINEELVLTLHVLNGMYANCRRIETNGKRYKSEIIEIVKAAVKISKKQYNDKLLESYKTDSNSYFE